MKNFVFEFRIRPKPIAHTNIFVPSGFQYTEKVFDQLIQHKLDWDR